MRVIILGLGAIGGTVAAALSLAGQEVLGIARGRQLEAIRDTGLLLKCPDFERRAQLGVVASPAEVTFRPDDMIVICTKTQDSAAAMDALRDAGVEDQPVFCLQNGVENERLALRRFANVHAATVMMPAQYVVPGEVACFGTPRLGIVDLGRYPGGTDSSDVAMAEVLNAAGIAAFPSDDVMASKYGKLVLNLGNAVQAVLGREADTAPITKILREEGQSVLGAAGIPFLDVGASDPRRKEYLNIGEIAGEASAGTSSVQSLLRGTGSIETDYLNGEIALLARLYGVPAPGNAWFTRRAARMVAEGAQPGSVSRDEVERALGL